MSLNAQIRDAERQILKRRQGLGPLTAQLIRKLHQQMTAPGSLLLAVGVGFVIGELSKRQAPSFRDISDQPDAAETTPFRTVLNFVTLARTLSAILPLAWMMKSFREEHGSGCGPAQQCGSD